MRVLVRASVCACVRACIYVMHALLTTLEIELSNIGIITVVNYKSININTKSIFKNVRENIINLASDSNYFIMR